MCARERGLGFRIGPCGRGYDQRKTLRGGLFGSATETQGRLGSARRMVRMRFPRDRGGMSYKVNQGLAAYTVSTSRGCSHRWTRRCSSPRRASSEEGTAIALVRDEVRESTDIDFIISGVAGYRYLRSLFADTTTIEPITCRSLPQQRRRTDHLAGGTVRAACGDLSTVSVQLSSTTIHSAS